MIARCLPWMHDFRPVDSLVVDYIRQGDELPTRWETEVYDRCWRCPKLRTRTLKGRWSRAAVGLAT